MYKEIKNGAELVDIFVLSLGTGKLAMQSNVSDRQLFWDERRLGHCITSMTEQTHKDVDELLGEEDYLRLQPLLEKRVGFADTSPETLEYLANKAFQVIQENQDAFD